MPETNKRATFLTLGVLAFLAILPPVALALDRPYMVTLANRMLVYALAAVALDLVMGYGRMVSFGHAAFLGLGAYTVGILHHHDVMMTPFLFGWAGSNEALLAWPLAMLVAAGYALLVGAISLRTGGVYFIMITLAFAQMVFFFFVSLIAYGGRDGLVMFSRNSVAGTDILGSRVVLYYVCLGCLVAVLAFLVMVVRSRFGRIIEGCRQNEQRMRALGYKPFVYKLTAFVLSGALAGLAGALLANHSEFVSPDFLSWESSGLLMVMVLLGGLSTLVGPIYGALTLFALEEVLVAYTPHWQLVLGPVLILAVLFFKGGLYGWMTGKRTG
ncbi:branched-chain amino acid ABC transporter permease [Aquisalimonas lutea]|uniref:branched-chain amino acid ABC transporter permease n=1 Tax=Aquisalimonas lutea TaxID=1327750 RepID=UPI0025B5EDBE|nr:branched-chain amino acid ABC transporter permease [Aquisalimonas lutea]MDN3519501.1 branched-chain amino acid ABC transporter permease [Aquisalimonas lutea]